MDFKELIGEKLSNLLLRQGITASTPIQREAIPVILAKKDIIARSATGTGKTLAYLLPVFSRLDYNIRGAQAIILAPTFELCAQIYSVAKDLADNVDDVALIIGSANKTRQLETLKKKPKVIIGSIGRLTQHIEDKKLSVHNVKTLVFDEADRLFEPVFMESISKIIKSTLRDRQILLFSASMPDNTIALASEFMNNPTLLFLDDYLPKSIRHFYIRAEPRQKFDVLRKLIYAEKAEKTIVFVNIPYTIEKIATRLNFHKLEAMPLYGAARKAERKHALTRFRLGRTKLLVSSDIGSRGLDINNLSHIINLDLPDSEKDYLHRAGRCGRMGATGKVISIVTPKEAVILEKFASKLGIEITQKTLSFGKFL